MGRAGQWRSCALTVLIRCVPHDLCMGGETVRASRAAARRRRSRNHADGGS